MRITIQIIQLHLRQSIPCIVLSSEQQRYFFNMPDKFQRLAREHSVRFSEGNRFFLTQLSADHIVGLYGVAAALQENDLAKGAQLYGPPGLSKYLESVKFRHLFRDLLKNFYEFYVSSKDLHETEEEKIEKEKEKKAFEEFYHGFMKKHGIGFPDRSKNPNLILNKKSDYEGQEYFYKDQEFEIHGILLEQQDLDIKPSLCYIIKPNKAKGKIDAEKLKTHNITKQLIGKLFAAGELEVDGVIHKAIDFKDPDSPSPLVLIIDCPTLSHFESLLKQKKIHCLFANSINTNDEDLKVIIHMTPTSVLQDPRYNELLQQFQSTCQHVFVNADFKPLMPEMRKEKASTAKEVEEEEEEYPQYAHYTLTNVMAKHFPEHFPVLKDLEPRGIHDLHHLFPNIQGKSTSQNMTEYVLVPPKNQGFNPIHYLVTDKVQGISQLDRSEKFMAKYEELLVRLANNQKDQEEVLNFFKDCDPELVFLGTQAMKPSAFCNVSGIYLRFWQQSNYGFMLDCGEGSYFQLLHHYGAEKTRDILKGLKVIYITHIHTDHHAGLLQMIRERDRVMEEEGLEDDPLFLLIPYICGTWINNFSQMVSRLNCKVIFNHHIRAEEEEEIVKTPESIEEEEEDSNEEEEKTDMAIEESKGEEEVEKKNLRKYLDPKIDQYLEWAEKECLENVALFEEFLKKELGIIKFKALDADHCAEAYGVYFKHESGWSFVYSGDTRPYDKMVRQARNATILVHEASFGEDLGNEAIGRKHSTNKEAIEIGMKLKAWRTILTHFSLRYELSNQSKKFSEEEVYREYCSGNVVKAYDQMRMRFSQLNDMPAISDCLEGLFDDPA